MAKIQPTPDQEVEEVKEQDYLIIPDLHFFIKAASKFDAQRKAIELCVKVKEKLDRTPIDYTFEDYELDPCRR